jgi:hypothetical protein
VIAANPAYANNTDKQPAGNVSRLFQILRNHGLIRKLPKQNRCIVTLKGSQITKSTQVALTAFIQWVTEMAA